MGLNLVRVGKTNSSGVSLIIYGSLCGPVIRLQEKWLMFISFEMLLGRHIYPPSRYTHMCVLIIWGIFQPFINTLSRALIVYKMWLIISLYSTRSGIHIRREHKRNKNTTKLLAIILYYTKYFEFILLRAYAPTNILNEIGFTLCGWNTQSGSCAICYSKILEFLYTPSIHMRSAKL